MNHVLHSLCALGLAACVVPTENEPVDDLATAETESPLLVSSWSAPANISATTIWYGQVATVGNRTFMVHSGPGTQLRWRERFSSGWTEPNLIPGQDSGTKVSLAPFNGFLYMIRTSPNVPTQLHVSRFDPSTNQWSTSFQIPHTSFGGPPALAAFDGRLQLIGVDPSTKMLWRATMTTAEAFSAAAAMPGHYSHARVSATVASCKLYIAHRAGATTQVVYNSFNGSSWGADLVVPGVVASEVAIAERAGYLHLVYREANSIIGAVPVWWTYFDGTSWPTPVTVGGATSHYAPTLTNGGPGLVAGMTTYYNSIGSSMTYTQPLPPRVPIGCFVVQPPIGF